MKNLFNKIIIYDDFNTLENSDFNILFEAFSYVFS